MRRLGLHLTRRVARTLAGPLPRAAAIACAAATAMIGQSAVAQAEILDRVLAVVAGNVITLTDVYAARDLGLQPVAAGAPDPIRAILSQLIDRALVLVEVERYAPPDPSAEAVEAELTAVRARFASRAEFDAVLTRAGIDETALRERFREDLRIRAYEDQRFATGGDRRDQLIADWIAALRRRGDITDLYLPTSRN